MFQLFAAQPFNLLSLFVTLLVLCLVFAVAYWVVTLVAGAMPEPTRNTARMILLALLGLIAIVCLLDLIGLIGPQRHVWIAL